MWSPINKKHLQGVGLPSLALNEKTWAGQEWCKGELGKQETDPSGSCSCVWAKGQQVIQGPAGGMVTSLA